MLLKKYYSNKKVIVTGHTGFKGSWLSIWLKLMGAEVVGISHDVPSDPSNYSASNINEFVRDVRIDIRDFSAIGEIFKQEKPDFVFHLAAQALVRDSYANPLDTFSTNALGSVGILDALRNLDANTVAVMITSDKAYDNVEWNWGYRETDRLGGKDPYSASKGMAELAIRSYVDSFFRSEGNIKVAIARAGNVIGGGDWAIDRIVPDCMKSWSKGESLSIRSPEATRPWQHVLEPLGGYLFLGAMLSDKKELQGEAFNFGPTADQNYSVRNLITAMSSHWDQVKWEDVSNKAEQFHEAGLLKLNCDKALALLNWVPTLNFEETVEMTVNWYKAYYSEKLTSMHEFTQSQIYNYIDKAKRRNKAWAIDK